MCIRDSVEEDRIGGVTARLYSVPTVRRQRSTIEEHAPEVAALVAEDEADVALLVPT